MSSKGNSATPRPSEGWLSIDQAAEYTGLSDRTIRDAINNPAYPVPLIAHRVGPKAGRVRIERTELDAWMRGHSEVA